MISLNKSELISSSSEILIIYDKIALFVVSVFVVALCFTAKDTIKGVIKDCYLTFIKQPTR